MTMTDLSCILEQFLTCSQVSEDFLDEYKKLNKKKEAPELYNLALTEIDKAISVGDVEKFLKLSNFIKSITEVENPAVLKDYYDSGDNSINHANLVILACKYNQIKILKHIFGNLGIINNLSIDIGKDAIAPDDEDEMSHNSFYYAIRSGSVELLETLISKWPDNYFEKHLEEFDKILSSAYEELKLKSVSLLKEIEFLVEYKLLTLRFYLDTSDKRQSNIGGITIEERIKFVVETISSMLVEYHSKAKKIDKKFLYLTKFVIKNIHILKQQLKSTYDKLPWEEIEFCLICYVTSFIKQDNLNLIHRAILSRSKILSHLKNFEEKLENYSFAGMHASKLDILPNLKRELVVEQIVKDNPQFKDLYCDYRQIKDIHSLQIMDDHINIAQSVDPTIREGQLILTRTLQVIGESLKNTLEASNLSPTTSNLLLLSLPKTTRDILTDIRNLISPAHLLEKVDEIENMDDKFFDSVQTNTGIIKNTITSVLFNNKVRIIRMLLKNIISSKNSDEIKELITVFSYVNLNEFSPEVFKTIEYKRFESLIEKLDKVVSPQQHDEPKFIEEINDIINSEKNKFKSMKIDYILQFSSLKALIIFSNDDVIDGENAIKNIKYNANQAFKYLSSKIQPCSVKKIVELSLKFCYSSSYRLALKRTYSFLKVECFNPNFLERWCRNMGSGGDAVQLKSEDLAYMSTKVDKINQLFFEIYNAAQFIIDSCKWNEELKKKLNNRHYFTIAHKQISIFVTKETYSNRLKAKLFELKRILSENALTASFSAYKMNKKLQAIVEILLLDIMSILDILKNSFKDNIYFLDSNVSLLMGKNLISHLKYYNAIVDVLLCDPLVAIILNAQIVTSENIIQWEKKFGKSELYNLTKLKCKKEKDLITIENQENLFIAVEKDNVEETKICCCKGGDIKGRNINLWTIFHFAAKGSSLEILKMNFNQNLNMTDRDICGRNPLHVAAAYGRHHFIESHEALFSFNHDDNSGKMPLHNAAQNGHQVTVELLLKNKANIAAYDKNGLTALYYAIRNGHADVAKFLLGKADIDPNKTFNGFFLLHEAAEKGFLETVILLVEYGANINIKDDRDRTPLCAAICNRHIKVVKFLISKGADINIQVIGGFSPLFFAAQNGSEEIVKIFLENGAQADIFSKTIFDLAFLHSPTDRYESNVKRLSQIKHNDSAIKLDGVTPMHIAAYCGHINIVTIFLEHGVSIDIRSKNNSTPLHFASLGGHKSLVDLLFQNKALVNAVDSRGFIPLHLAACEGYANVVNLLIKKGADVNAISRDGITPLHLAALNGKHNIIDILIKNNAYVNSKNNNNITPLYVAVKSGYIDSVALLVKNNADVNVMDNNMTTPLHVAAKKGDKIMVDFLIENHAKINAKDNFGDTPLYVATIESQNEIVDILISHNFSYMEKDDKELLLLIAVNNNCIEIVKVLLANGVNLFFEIMFLAAFVGHSDIVKHFLRSKASIHLNKLLSDLLPMVIERGHKEIVDDLIKNGADVNIINSNITPMFVAARENHSEIAEILLVNGANIEVDNFKSFTPLHAAVTLGHYSTVKVLLDNNANIDAVRKNKTPLEVAVSMRYLQVVKLMLKYNKGNINAKRYDSYTLLHNAAQTDYAEMVKYLIQEGADIHAKSVSGQKPIHIAAANGCKNVVQFLISKGSKITGVDVCRRTVLHCAISKDQYEIAKYLIEEEKADLNTIDVDYSTPLHTAAFLGSKNIAEVLLKNGAIYNAFDLKFFKKPAEVASNSEITDFLIVTEQLFKAVKNNSPSEVEELINIGAFVNAKNAENGTPLHFASWKGYTKVVKVLLKYKSNPNSVHGKRFTPLHYAAKFSHLEVVKDLLCNGAMYNAVSTTNKAPNNMASDESIKRLFNIVHEAFKCVKNNNTQIINKLKKINDFSVVKAVLNARNKENKSLVVSALLNNFSRVDDLKEVLQDDVSSKIDRAFACFANDNNEEALRIFKTVLIKRKEILGSDNPGTLDIQSHIANIYSLQKAYDKAMALHEEIYHKQKKMLGLKHRDTLTTRSAIALALLGLQKPEALDVYKEIYSMQKEVLGPNHTDTLKSQLYIAMILDEQEKYDEALYLSEYVYEKMKESNNMVAIHPLNIVAQILAHQGKFKESLKLFHKVMKQRKSFFGDNHPETLKICVDIGKLLFKLKKYPESLKTFKELLNIQSNVLGVNHTDVLFTKFNVGNVLFSQCKWIEALIVYKEIFGVMKSSWGANNSCVLDCLLKIELIHLKFKCESQIQSDEERYYSTQELLQRYISVGVNNADVQTIEYILKCGIDINAKDTDGRTPLHYACNNGCICVVKILLENGADATNATNKGNTPLHTTVSKGYKRIVEVLLQHVTQSEITDYVNAPTTAGKNTPLHVAAKNGFIDIVLCLLEYGAVYNSKNREGCLPFDLSKNDILRDILKLIGELFEDVKTCNINITNKLKVVKMEHISAVTNSRDNNRKTLLQVAIAKKHQIIANEILRTLYVKLRKS